MIIIKNKQSIEKMHSAGRILASMFQELKSFIKPGISTLDIDAWIDKFIIKNGLVSKTKGFKSYKHSCCISINDELVHGVPRSDKIIKEGDVVKVDVCASYNGYCADMARPFVIGHIQPDVVKLLDVASESLDAGIAQMYAGKKLSDISHAIQSVIEKNGFSVVKDFAGHGIGKHMHEDPQVLNYGVPGKGPVLMPGMVFAIEPMINMGSEKIYVDKDGWTAKTVDGSMTAHVEDTVAITNDGPIILTRIN